MIEDRMSFYASNPDVRVCFTVLNWSPQRLLEHIPTIHVFLGPYLRGEEVPSTEGWISFDDRLRRQILCLTGQLRSASAFSLSRDALLIAEVGRPGLTRCCGKLERILNISLMRSNLYVSHT